MVRFVIKRLLLILPTLFFVMIIAFILSKMVPGDPVDAMLLLQGINHESSNYRSEYEKMYIKTGVNKPLSYISVQPHFYHPDLYKITDQTFRNQTMELLHQKRSYTDIQDFITVRNDFIKLAGRDTLYNNPQIRDKIKNLSFITDIREIKNEINALSALQKSDLSPSYSSLVASFQKMEAGKIFFFYPNISWHGFDNQFHQWLKNILKGNFGESAKDGRTVISKIISAIQWTLLLIILNLLVTNIIAIPSGLYSGYYAGGWYDKLSNFIWILLFAIPVFWLASMMIIYFTSTRYSVLMDIFPAPGNWYISDDQSFGVSVGQYAGQLILPIICLVANDIAQVSRVIRNNVVQQKKTLYALFAKSKGLNGTTTLFKHIFPNVLIPMVTLIGGRLPAGLSGALIIEVIFNIPGMGRLMMESINSYDWNVVFGILIVVSFFTILFMLMTDIVYQLVNPKMKTSFDI
jgi:peptide/nickel transport system permease protein